MKVVGWKVKVSTIETMDEQPSIQQSSTFQTIKRSAFDRRLDELKAYKSKHGHFDVKQHEDESLHKWIENVRTTFLLACSRRESSWDEIASQALR